jgi:hypothetical protein
MLLLAFAFTVSPLVFEHRLVLALVFCVKTIAHVSFAVLVAVVSYGLTLLAVVTSYRYGQPSADILYSFGFGLATFLAVCTGSIVMPRWLSWHFVPAAVGFSAVFPISLFLRHGISGDWRGGFLWYLAGSLAGSLGAVRLIYLGRSDQRVRATTRTGKTIDLKQT